MQPLTALDRVRAQPIWRDAAAPMSTRDACLGTLLDHSSGGLMATTLQKLRQEAFAHQCGHCFYCTFPMWETHGKAFARKHGISTKVARFLRCTAEHLRARQDGGRDEAENVAAACVWCNQQRHANGTSTAPSPQVHRDAVRESVRRGEWHPAAAHLTRHGALLKPQPA